MLASMKRRLVAWLDRELSAARVRAAAASATLAPGAQVGQEAVIENLAGDAGSISIGAYTHVRGHLLTYGHGGRIAIGDWAYVGVRSMIWSMDSITIGDRVLIAHDVNIHDGTAHSTDAAERHAHYRHLVEHGHPTDAAHVPGLRSAPVVIEDDVWISFGVTILKGVRIGAGSVIAAGSIVTDDVPAGMLYRCEVAPTIGPLQ